MVLPSPPTSFAWRNAMRQTLSVSLGERVASDWHSRFAQSLAQGCSLPIPKGEPRQATTLRNATQRQQRKSYTSTLCLFGSYVCPLAYSAQGAASTPP